MKFKDLQAGDIFEIVLPWTFHPTKMMKVYSSITHLNAVYINWRAGTLDHIHDDVKVVNLSPIKNSEE